MSEGKTSRTRGFVLVGLAYVAAFAAAWAVVWFMGPGHSKIATFAAADAAATAVVFLWSLALDNSSVYDAYWSVAPMAIAPALAFGEGSAGAPMARRIVVTALVVAWGARLTWNWARGWHGLGHEDFRYVDLRPKMGRLYWVVSFVGLHFMPTVSVFLGCLALFPALVTGSRPLSALDAAAFVVTAGAILLEARADAELRVFRLRNDVPGKLLDTGVWAYCRHPNYLGEMSFWWGLFLFGLAADPSVFWTLAGPAWITSLFVFVSIPLMDKRSLSRRPAYAAHMQRVPALFPRPPRKDTAGAS
jgi:steroid 5-alpha reductase family enzyme